jgi:hypothetical protein
VIARAQSTPADYDLSEPFGAHFFTETNGGNGNTGFAVSDADGIPFWTYFQQVGGVQTVGYPVSSRFLFQGFVVQAFQKVVFQWQPATQSVAYLNIIDLMHNAGLDPWLQAYKEVPPMANWSSDTGLPFSQVIQNHLALLNANQAIKQAYFSDPNWLQDNGLPMAPIQDMGGVLVLRCQRKIFQQWLTTVPWAQAGQVVVANGGDLAKTAGFFPHSVITPQPDPQSAPSMAFPDHDWFVPGYYGARHGHLLNPSGTPYQAIGANIPNLLYGEDIAANLQWLYDHHVRWIRIFATGHGLPANLAPASASAVIARLRALLDQVQEFNATHDPTRSLALLVTLTDYYSPGVPGDRFAYDHPKFKVTPVLPAPWYRHGILHFSFDQEWGFGTETNMPNYEVNYKPWVEQIVPAFANNPDLLGWQLGNELKARGSPRNGISSAEAYNWYLSFTKDMVDTIRRLDHNHLIIMGAQYIAELTDWEYRPHGTLQPSLIPQYHRLVTQMLTACSQACWNVWSLTDYDFNRYALDDLLTFHSAGIAVIATEYGFSLDIRNTTTVYGGNRAVAISSGFTQPWPDLSGTWHHTLPSLLTLMTHYGLSAAAPWGAPAPGLTASLDTDPNRGLTNAPDATTLWTTWSQIGAYQQPGTAIVH